MEKFKPLKNTLISASLIGPLVLSLAGCKDSPEQTCDRLADLHQEVTGPSGDDWEDISQMVTRLEDSIGDRTDAAALAATDAANMAEIWAASNGAINSQNTIDLTEAALRYCDQPDA